MRYLLFLFLTVFSWSATTTACPTDGAWVLVSSSAVTYNGSTTDLASKLAEPPLYQSCFNNYDPANPYDIYRNVKVTAHNPQYDFNNGTQYYGWGYITHFYKYVGACQPGEEIDNSGYMPVCWTNPCTVPNSSYDASNEGCKCDTGYLPSYGLNGLGQSTLLSCDLPECPEIYTEHQPPLPLFAEVSNPANCNFFPFGDNAVATLLENVKYCCYGQQNEDNNSTCSPNEIQIGDNCYPIQNNDDNSTDPKTCEAGSSWSDSANQCLPDSTYSNDLNGTMDNNKDNNGTQGALPNQGDIDAFLDIANFDGLKDEMSSLVNRYVLIQLPVNVGGTCTNEFIQTFNFMGHSYTINLNSYMSAVYDYLPLLKGIILFMMALSGVVIVLSSGRD